MESVTNVMPTSKHAEEYKKLCRQRRLEKSYGVLSAGELWVGHLATCPFVCTH
jgi:hypothetical protein